MIDLKKVGAKITQLRKKRGLTQDEVAEKIFVTRQLISKWEKGNGTPSIDSILDLCQLFGVSFEEILCLREERQ